MYYLVLLAGLVYGLLLALSDGSAPVDAFLVASAATYTWCWYLTAALGGIGILLAACQLAGLNGIVGFILSGRVSHFALKDVGAMGFMGVGIFFLTAVMFAIKAALFIGGTYLLMSSGSLGDSFSDLSLWRLIVGAVLIALGYFAGTKYKYKVTHTVTRTVTRTYR
jgi:hypothetical protein